MFGAGKAYREEFFESFGFTDAAIPLSFQDITYLGITKQLLILMAAPWFAMAFVFGYIVLFMVMSLIVDRLAIRQQRKFRSNKKPSGNVDYLFNLSGFLLGLFGSIAITSLLAFFYIAQADKLGKKDAASARDSLVQGSKVKPELSYVVIERVIGGKQVTNEGYLIGCSERVCAVYQSL